jgi:hypothetical protein
MATDSPLTAPCADGDRGSMLGSSDHHQNSSATAAPPSVGGRSSHRVVAGRCLPWCGYRHACRGSRQPVQPWRPWLLSCLAWIQSFLD